MRRRLIDTDVGRVGIERINGYPGRLVAAPDPDLVAGEAERDPLVLIIEIEPDLVGGGIVRKIERGDQTVCSRPQAIVDRVQCSTAVASPGKAGIDKGADPAVHRVGVEIAAVIANETRGARSI